MREHVERLIEESREWLAARGEIVVGSGRLQAAGLSAWLHSDFGPADQDKPSNQDYALAWRPSATASRKSPRMVFVLADGLTTSLRSEHAAALACWSAVRAFAEVSTGADPLERARLALNEAGLSIGQVADQLARDPQSSCPEGQFLSTWKYILAKGALLQTTLALGWYDRDHFRLAAIGDGGAVWREYSTAGSHTDRVLARCDLTSQQVRCLGPGDRCVRQLDVWREEPLRGPAMLAAHTDGIGRGLGDEPLAVLDALDRLAAHGAENPPRQYIEQAIAARPAVFADNLTLALVKTG